MLREVLNTLKSPLQRLKEWNKYRNSWEVSNRRLEYNTVVKQISGYVVHVDEVVEYKNSIDGATKEKRRKKGNTLVSYNLYWKPGNSVLYNGEQVKCAEEANLFGNVARGYGR